MDCNNWKCPGGLKDRWMIAQGVALGSDDDHAADIDKAEAFLAAP